jgi:short-subunit dehydrogenase
MGRGLWHGNVAIVTGASSGIGRELALQLASQGAHLMLAARDSDRLRETARQCVESGGSAEFQVTNVAQKEHCKALVDKTIGRYGRVDSLFNNAGTGARGDFEEHQEIGVFEELMGVNYFGPIYCTHYALPYVRKTRGRIVTTSSIVGRLAVPGESAYCASKFAVTGFFDSLRMELMGTGVSVTVVHPGYVVTEFAERTLKSNGEPQGHHARKMYTSKMMTPERCARLILRGAARRKREIFTSFREKLSLWFKLAAPNFTDRMIVRHVREKDERMDGG